MAHKKEILKKYRWSFCGDEYFVASELYGAKEHFEICDTPKLLYVDFIKDSPRSIPLGEYDSLKGTGYLWARKFTSQ